MQRFLAEDPMRSGEVASWSPYAYALDSPMIFSDPSGLTAENCGAPAMLTVADMSLAGRYVGAGSGGGGAGGSQGCRESASVCSPGRRCAKQIISYPCSSGGRPAPPERIRLPNGSIVTLKECSTLIIWSGETEKKCTVVRNCRGSVPAMFQETIPCPVGQTPVDRRPPTVCVGCTRG
jgi:hypothetical protein